MIVDIRARVYQRVGTLPDGIVFADEVIGVAHVADREPSGKMLSFWEPPGKVLSYWVLWGSEP